MAATSPTSETTDDGVPALACYRTCPEKSVFTEPGNVDGWISTDTTVELER
ncbi:hypothetical protein [Natronomonas sp. EA1]|uniref:hypothetical protein n=1 Tax=Natronomonas sp. EA1 TaxID=3421655 RepID=UPI003EBC5E99